jgi:hypothetical protein
VGVPTTLDHLILAAPDLAAGAARFAELTGVEPVRGGSHPGGGTANVLAGLEVAPGVHSYVELIGPDPAQDTAALERLNLDVGTVREFGLHTWAVRPDDFDGAVTGARDAGVDLGHVRDMSRQAPDGALLEWRLTERFPLPEAGAQPFLIDWKGTPHPSTRLEAVLRLVELEVVSPDPAAAASALELLGAPGTTVVRGERAALRVVLETPNGRVELTSLG